MASAVLVLNVGSSSLKFALHRAGKDLPLLLRGQISGIGGSNATLAIEPENGEAAREDLGRMDQPAALRAFTARLDALLGQVRLVGIGHRVVHGGDLFQQPTLVNEDTLTRLDALTALAPLHQPHNIAGLRALFRQYPGVPQVACFDTAFHCTVPETERLFALPRELIKSGIRRYGFHGLSYEFIAEALPGLLGDRAWTRTIVAHLGRGASLCALRKGKSVATTMSFSPLDGLPMGTRCGALDPSVALFLHRTLGMSIDEIEVLLNERSGLLGVSGISSEMHILLDDPHPTARQAVDLFVLRTIQAIGAMAATLSGVDALVFTGGIGEHSALLRGRIVDGCQWLGLRLDRSANAGNGPCISSPDSPVSAWVIPTNEERVIARHTLRLLASSSAVKVPPMEDRHHADREHR